MKPITACLLAFALLPATAALAKVKPVSLQDRQQAACYDDVNKFCKDAMPSVDKVTACMQDKKPLVSEKCAALWDETE
ncbi:hypothetical protein P7D22_20560 [Lichenihabitans sp. Uapishka_5]|uniref:hypothetical protein n=1 Tax=Lichenihabitans sp. Uapishka_5 TaxID=3037302 RepID=UPI0029E7E180|nr:hypothetical protein [Lichenihabitans sp. Uapishka_5]MDX7953560.1 hypothetical protein [Lichenihabitans sp. Uapishka_5]